MNDHETAGDLAPDRARGRFGLSHQRPRRARPRRADPVCRCRHRRAFAGAGAPGQDRRNHPGQARAAPPRAGRRRRRRRTACPPPRSRTAAQGRRNQPDPRRGRDRPARRTDRRPEEAGAAGDPLPRSRRQGAQGRGDAVPSALAARPMPMSPKPAAPTTSTSANSPSAPASRPKPPASRRSAPRNCRRCARPKPAPPPACSASPMPARRSTARKQRAKERVAELDRRLTQFAADVEREQRQSSDADVALQRLDAEDAELKEEIKSRVEKRSGVDERVAEAETTLAAAERLFTELTTALADLTAKRNQSKPMCAAIATACARLDQDIANVQGEVEKLAQQTSGLGDLDALAAAIETAQQSLAQAEATAQAQRSRAMSLPGRSSKPRARRWPRPTSACSGWRPKPRPSPSSSTARPRICGRRSSTASASPRATRRRWAPRSATISTRRSIRRRRCAGPMPASTDGDPALPEGVESLAAHVQAPPNWRAVWRRSASSPASAAPNWCRSSRPASGWCRAKATSGAGTASSPRPTRRPARHGGSPSARG